MLRSIRLGRRIPELGSRVRVLSKNVNWNVPLGRMSDSESQEIHTNAESIIKNGGARSEQ